MTNKDLVSEETPDPNKEVVPPVVEEPVVDEPKEPVQEDTKQSPLELRKLKNEAQRLRKQRNEAREKLEAYGDLTPDQIADILEEKDTLSKRVTDQEQSKRDLLVSAKLEAATVRLGAVEAEVVEKLINPDNIVFDDNGLPTNIEELVQDLLDEKPFLRAKATDRTARHNEGKRRGSKIGRSNIDAKTAYDMSPEEFMKSWNQ